MEKQGKVYNLFPILFFMSDTAEHNKLCSLCGGPNAMYLCHIFDFPNTFFDKPCTAMTLEENQDPQEER